MDYDYDDCELTPQQRKKKKQEEILLVKAKLKTAQGSITPIEVKPRAKIAKSFWAKKWYENLSTYEDLDYRLQMGGISTGSGVKPLLFFSLATSGQAWNTASVAASELHSPQSAACIGVLP